MLEKHNNSKINNILGIILCTVLLVFALTKAPQSIAGVNADDNNVSFNFDETPLQSILELIYLPTGKDIIGYDNVPDIKLSFQAWQVSREQVEKLILKCSGLKLVVNGSQFEIVKSEDHTIVSSKTNECINTMNSK